MAHALLIVIILLCHQRMLIYQLWHPIKVLYTDCNSLICPVDMQMHSIPMRLGSRKNYIVGAEQ